jgi:hypothetical protein
MRRRGIDGLFRVAVGRYRNDGRVWRWHGGVARYREHARFRELRDRGGNRRIDRWRHGCGERLG